MAASIATLSGFSGWTGKLHPAVRRIARLPSRPGINGAAWVYDGWETRPDTITTRYIATDYAAANANVAAARALQDGATYTVEDPEGKTWPVKVIGVVPETFVRANTGVLVAIAWTFQVEAATP